MISVKHIFLLIYSGIYLYSFSDSKSLDDYIHDYEPLVYDTEFVHEKHERHKRSTDYLLQLPLQAFGRYIQLELKKDPSVFTDDHKLELSNGTLVDADLSFLYSGTVRGIPGSFCHGSVIRGVFQGSIYLPDETYHVEKSDRFFNNTPVFHSVIYRESDMDFALYKQSTLQGGQKADYMKYETNGDSNSKYTDQKSDPHQRRRRNVINLAKRTMNTCRLYLRSDLSLWERYMHRIGGTVELALQEILALFSAHVHAVNRIFGGTVFHTYDGSVGYAGVQFSILRTQVVSSEDCSSSKRQSSWSFLCLLNLDPEDLLYFLSEENHDLFCLTYTFTHRDFIGGILGLSWMASPDSRSGGICERYKNYTSGQIVEDKSLNTGIVTTINYNKDIPPKISQLNFAHQLGHSFGAPHDTGSMCAPFGTNRPDSADGNYIMFGETIAGDRPHNSHFSSCSRDSIARVLDAVVNSRYNKHNCFTASGPFCGNRIVEDGEECDCGFSDECEDACCNPNACKLKPGALCSPSQGPCCTDTCQIVSSAAQKTCSFASDCTTASVCSIGMSAVCPDPVQKTNGSYCREYGATCHDGECTGSICSKIGWSQCFVTNGTSNEMCTLACAPNGTSSVNNCIVSSDDTGVDDHLPYKILITDVRTRRNSAGLSVPASGIQLSTGSPCNNYEGYCDVFHRCRTITQDIRTPRQTEEITTVPVTGTNEITTVSKAAKAGDISMFLIMCMLSTVCMYLQTRQT